MNFTRLTDTLSLMHVRVRGSDCARRIYRRAMCEVETFHTAVLGEGPSCKRRSRRVEQTKGQS